MRYALTVFFACALLLAGCATQPSTTGEGPIQIGVIAPQTGDVAAIGQAVANGAQLAAEEINAAGGVNGKMIEVIVEDGRCNSADAATAGNKLIALDGVQYIVGGACSGETLAVAPIANEHHTVMLSPTSSAPAVTDAGDYVFRDYPSDTFAGSFMARYAYEELGLRHVAVLACINDYCQGLADKFSEEFSSMDGASIVGTERFEMESRDLRTQIGKIQQEEPDGIFFLAYTEAAIPGLKQMKEMGVEAQIFGTDTYDDPRVLTESGEAGEGVIFAIPYTPDAPEFKANYQQRFGTEITIGGPQAYDAVYIFAQVMSAGANTPEAVKDALYAMDPYTGVSGTIAFDENGDLRNAAYTVKQYSGGEAVTLQ